MKSFIVSRFSDGWRVTSAEGVLATRHHRHEAFRFAVEQANAAGKAGATTQVLTVGPNGEMVPTWVFGRDVYQVATAENSDHSAASG
jgi:hypothetical protein